MIGKTLGARYEIVDLIDLGGMALVYRALCRKTNNYVAVKVLKDKLAKSTEYVNRFKQEAQAAFSLDHQNVVKVTDIGFDEGVYFMVMEYVDGPTLKTVVEQSGGLPETKVVEYSLQICSALSQAHKKGIIHRDIKPHNVLIDQHDNAKITDFGIAESVNTKFSKNKQVIGSVYYVSPEQAKGENVDQRSDIYSFGIVLYEMLTGELPYTGDRSISVALKHINEKIVPPIQKNSSISASINNIVIKATSKRIGDRYNDIDEMKSDLIRSLVEKDGQYIDLRPDETSVLKPKNLRKNRIWKIVILAVTLAAITVAGIFGGMAIFGTPVAQPTQASQLHIPNLIGLDQDSAAIALEQGGFGVVYQFIDSSTVDAELVIEQEPSSGEIAAPGDIVVLTISTGPIVIYMPNLYGMTETEALEVIEAMGLVVEGVVYEVNEEVVPGTVVSQVPLADTDIIENTAVSLVISKQDVGVVPNMVDTFLDQAVSRLYESGFVNCFVFQDESDAEPGTVIAQTPKQGEIYQLDSDIDLTISEFTDLVSVGYLTRDIEITETGTKVKVVFEERFNDYVANFIVIETEEEPGTLTIQSEMFALTSGMKKVKIYIHNIIAYEFDIEFIERSDLG